ncbi:type II toxin-antitoxin system VapC family toxin [Beijerinckia sp. L45]|uniref:type II toxin-antitoxin system VapC family toxin n=1 Tax=Beijerinckia sp. L45 TaxID=1641855 RepID=UPI001FEDDA33|nr:type II toxin-antitoxin system VapC family toxin [Beijerinckia sp. L45]
MIVDASAMIEVLLRTDKAADVEMHLTGTTDGLHGPHLVDVEVAQVLRRFVLRGELGVERAARALESHAQFPMRRHAHTTLLQRAWQWRDNLSAYDAIYVALAEALDLPLVTCDARLGKAAGTLVNVLVV